VLLRSNEQLEIQRNGLEETLGLAHRTLQVKGSDVLPLLLQQRDQEVDRQHGVGHDLVLGHVDVANGDTKTQDLLELELDGRSNFVDLLGEVLRVGDGGGEFSSLGETGTKKTRNLLDQSLGGEESVVLLGELLDELFVLVELLQVLNGHERELLVKLLCSVDIHGVGENAQRHPWSRDVGEFDGTGETLVPLGVVVLETDLELDSLDKVPLFTSSIFVGRLA